MMEINREKFGITKFKEEVELFILKNSQITVEILNYGGIIRKIIVPDKNGMKENIVLGYEKLKNYEVNPGYFGCITGRVAGRIKEGKLKINGTLYELEINNGGNNLHGGVDSLNKKVWKATPSKNEKQLKLLLEYVSPHLENGFPGEVKFSVEYILENRDLTINYLGIPDRETYISLTNHSSFNLSGNLKRDIYKQKIKVMADEFLEVDEETLPVRVRNVEETVFDLREEKTFESFIKSKDSQIEIVNEGIDHGFILELKASDENKIKCQCRDEESGRVLKVYTDQPAMVLYTGNYLEGTGELLGGVIGKKHLGFCLETQDYPDVFNSFPNKVKIYSPTNYYKQTTTYSF